MSLLVNQPIELSRVQAKMEGYQKVENSSEFRSKDREFLSKKMLPFGLYNPLATGMSGRMLVKASKDKAREEKAGNISSRTIRCGNEQYQRIVLTQKGIMELLNRLDSDDPLRMGKIERIGIRNGLNAAQTKRLIRMADAHSFFTSAGIENIYSAIANYNENPFVTSIPEQLSGENIPFYRFVQKALTDYALTANLGDPTENRDMALFLPASCHTLNEMVVRGKHGKIIHSKCNSVGLLIDFINSHLYIVYKSLDKENIFWSKNSYETLLNQLIPYIKKWGIKNIDSIGYVMDAIVLCETKGELENKAAFAQNMAKPFQHVYPIVMKTDGMDLLRSLMTTGAMRYRELEIEQANCFIYHASVPASPSQLFPLLYRGEPMTVATTIDYAQIADLISIYKYNKSFYIACWKEQIPFYMWATDIPKGNFVPIGKA